MGMAEETQEEVGLLETLQRYVGCMYLSDLHGAASAKALIGAMAEIADDRFLLEEWKHAANYIMGHLCECSSVQQIKNCLNDHLLKAYLISVGARRKRRGN